MSSRYNPQLAADRELEMAILRLKEGVGSKEDFARLANGIEDLGEQSTRNALNAVGEIGQRAIGMMGAFRMVSAMLRDADGEKPSSSPTDINAMFGVAPELDDGEGEDAGEGKTDGREEA